MTLRAPALIWIAVTLLAVSVTGCGDSPAPTMTSVTIPEDVWLAFGDDQRETRPSPAELRSQLVFAAQSADHEALERLLEDGAPADARNRDGLPALFVAAEHADADTVRLLLDAGADPDATVQLSYNDDGVGYGGTKPGTPLSYATEAENLDTMQALLDAGVDVDGRDPNGATPLMAAARLNKVDAARLLLEYGAQPGARTPNGQTALDFVGQMQMFGENHDDMRRLLSEPR